MKTIGTLDRVNPVIADEADPDAVAFAKAYTKGFRGDHRPGGPTDADERASERFHSRYAFGMAIRHGFAGSGEVTYIDTVSGVEFAVSRSANGRTFYGTDHLISRVR